MEMLAGRRKGPNFITVPAIAIADTSLCEVDAFYKKLACTEDAKFLNIALRVVQDDKNSVSENFISACIHIIDEYRWWRGADSIDINNELQHVARGRKIISGMLRWIGEIDDGGCPRTNELINAAAQSAFKEMGLALNTYKNAIQPLSAVLREINFQLLRSDSHSSIKLRRGRKPDTSRGYFVWLCIDPYIRECKSWPSGYRVGKFKLFVDALYCVAAGAESVNLEHEVKRVVKDWSKEKNEMMLHQRWLDKIEEEGTPVDYDDFAPWE